MAGTAVLAQCSNRSNYSKQQHHLDQKLLLLGSDAAQRKLSLHATDMAIYIQNNMHVDMARYLGSSQPEPYDWLMRRACHTIQIYRLVMLHQCQSL